MMSPLTVYLMAISVGFTAKEAKVVTCIAHYESAFKPQALNINTNKSKDIGLMQINDWHVKSGRCADLDLSHPKDNMKCAHELYTEADSNWDIWVAYKKNRTKCQAYEIKS